jgi:hypothetical protein
MSVATLTAVGIRQRLARVAFSIRQLEDTDLDRGFSARDRFIRGTCRYLFTRFCSARDAGAE